MGFFSSVTKGITGGLGLDKAFEFVDGTILGGDAKDAANKAAAQQAASTDKSIALQRESRDLARADLAPFVEFGQGYIDPLQQLLTPEGQMDYLNSNPLFDLALDKTNKASLASNAARGLLNSGSTLAELNDNALLTAFPMLQNQTNNLFNALNIGQSSAAGQANTALTTGNAIADLTVQKGNALASGTVGAANARQQGFNNLLNLGGQLGAAYLGGA